MAKRRKHKLPWRVAWPKKSRKVPSRADNHFCLDLRVLLFESSNHYLYNFVSVDIWQGDTVFQCILLKTVTMKIINTDDLMNVRIEKEIGKDRDWVPEMCPSWVTALSWRRGLSSSMKLWAMQCRATFDRGVIAESSDKMWSTGGGNGKPPQYTCWENLMNCMKGQKDMTPKDESPRSKDVQCYWGRAEENYQQPQSEWSGWAKWIWNLVVWVWWRK